MSPAGRFVLSCGGLLLLALVLGAALGGCAGHGPGAHHERR